MSNRPQLHGYPIDRSIRDHRPVTTPLRQAFPAWVRRLTSST